MVNNYILRDNKNINKEDYTIQINKILDEIELLKKSNNKLRNNRVEIYNKYLELKDENKILKDELSKSIKHSAESFERFNKLENKINYFNKRLLSENIEKGSNYPDFIIRLSRSKFNKLFEESFGDEFK